jgi:glutathione S-transferase
MTQPVLFDYWRSSASYRVRIALNLKRIGYEAVAVDLAAGAQKAPEHRARNPQGFVPLLDIDGLRLSQSLAIIDYLDTTRPDPPLIPADPRTRPTSAPWRSRSPATSTRSTTCGSSNILAGRSASARRRGTAGTRTG